MLIKMSTLKEVSGYSLAEVLDKYSDYIEGLITYEELDIFMKDVHNQLRDNDNKKREREI